MDGDSNRGNDVPRSSCHQVTVISINWPWLVNARRCWRISNVASAGHALFHWEVPEAKSKVPHWSKGNRFGGVPIEA
jgi:hypothetical protein